MHNDITTDTWLSAERALRDGRREQRLAKLADGPRRRRLEKIARRVRAATDPRFDLAWRRLAHLIRPVAT
jgi:hypothetical protein